MMEFVTYGKTKTSSFFTFRSNKEFVIHMFVGVSVFYMIIVSFLLFKQFISYDKLSGKLMEVVCTEREKYLVVNGYRHKLKVHSEMDIESFSKYIGKELCYEININYGKNSYINSVDLIYAKYYGHKVPQECPYHYYKWRDFFIYSFIFIIIYWVIWLAVFHSCSKRMERIYYDRASSFSLINLRLKYSMNVIEEDVTFQKKKTCCYLKKNDSKHQYNYKFIYFDSDDGSFWKRIYKVQFYLESFKIRNQKTNEIVCYSQKFDRV